MSATTTTVPSEPAPLDRNIVHRCCALKVSGDQCRQFALRGQNYCVAHVSREPHVFEKPGHIIIPLLEDAAAVQLTATKILSGLANETIKPDVANAMNHTLNTVVRTLPRPAPLKPGHSQPRQQPALLTVDDNGAWVAPPEPWLDDSGNITTYDRLASTAKQPEPTDPVTAVTHSYQQLIHDLIRQKINREKAESAAARAAGLADPHPENAHYRSNGKCAFGIPFCDGPCDPEPCMFCRGDLHLQPTAPQYPGDNVLALVVALRTHISQQESNQQQEPRYPAQVSSSTKPIETLQVQPTKEAGRESCTEMCHRREGAPGSGTEMCHRREETPGSGTETCHRREGAPGLGTETCQGTTFSRAAQDPKKAGLQPLSTNTTDAPSPTSEGPLNPEPLVLDLKATADTPRPPRCRTERGTRNADRRTGAKRVPSYRPQPPACSHVVKFVTKANHHIPNEQKLAQPRKNEKSPQRATKNIQRSLPLLTLHQRRARYFANPSSPAADH